MVNLTDDHSETEGGLLGKRKRDESDSEDINPMNALLLHNLNASHNTQRRRDIKLNYKAKLPLDKLELERTKKQETLADLQAKRAEIVEKLKVLH